MVRTWYFSVNCKSMKQVYYRNLEGIGLTADQVKAIAASVQVPGGTNDQGDPVERPGLPSDHFRSPFPNDKADRLYPRLEFGIGVQRIAVFIAGDADVGGPEHHARHPVVDKGDGHTVHHVHGIAAGQQCPA